jgi:plasmid stabilization system protein ParE
MSSRVILTPTAFRHFEQAMKYTRERFGLVQTKNYGALLRKDLADIPVHHQIVATQYRDAVSGLGLYLQHTQHYYAVYKVLEDGVFVVIALLWEGRDIPAHIKELFELSQSEIDTIRSQVKMDP